jgi:ribosome-associated translation inhibitor RaiA
MSNTFQKEKDMDIKVFLERKIKSSKRKNPEIKKIKTSIQKVGKGKFKTQLNAVIGKKIIHIKHEAHCSYESLSELFRKFNRVVQKNSGKKQYRFSLIKTFE